jgi:hypothetical protein
MRTVLLVDRIGIIDPATGSEILVLKAVRAPFNVAGANVAKPFVLSPAELAAWDTPNAVRERGRLVRARLRSHPGVAQILDQLEQTPLGEVKPLYVVLTEGDAELINWETLCNGTDDFVALDQRWPIGRISDPVSGASRPPAALRLPVKVMVVISAFGVPGQAREWELFRKALLKARADGLDVRLKLLVGDPALRTAIEQAIAAGLTGVEVSHVDKTGSRVIQEIVGWAPNIVHFFCHGVADAAEQSLELATGSDYGDPAVTSGSVKVRTKQLVDMSMALSNPWLLTLNCCASGQAAKDLQSMAHQVVSAGFPAAVAMLEPVEAIDAHEFTRAFYSRIFASVQKTSAALAAALRVPFEWADAMYEARTAIRDLHNGNAESRREWVLPVLYVRGVDPFSFEPPHDHLPEATVREYKLKAKLVAEWLKGLPEDTSEAKRKDVIQKTLADVPAEFRPKPDGTFADG